MAATRRDYHKDSPVTVRVPAELVEWVDQQDGSRSAVIIEAIREKRDREAS